MLPGGERARTLPAGGVRGTMILRGQPLPATPLDAYLYDLCWALPSLYLTCEMVRMLLRRDSGPAGGRPFIGGERGTAGMVALAWV